MERRMKSVEGKVAFITGGASGVGLGMAKVFADAGMKVAIADIRQDYLDRAMAHFRKTNQAVHAICLDITDRAAMKRAAEETVRVFGKVHILCNNAGINIFKGFDESTYEDWDWSMNVNLNAVFNGVHEFLPHIRAHGEGGHIVNTASMASILAGPSAGIYTAAKFAVRGLSESLRANLAQYRIGVSVVCPGLVDSNIHRSEQIRPERYVAATGEDRGETEKRLNDIQKAGMDPIEMGEKILRGIKENRFYIFTHPEFKEEVAEICADMVNAFTDEAVDPQRAAFEKFRRQSYAEARAKANEIDN